MSDAYALPADACHGGPRTRSTRAHQTAAPASRATARRLWSADDESLSNCASERLGVLRLARVRGAPSPGARGAAAILAHRPACSGRPARRRVARLPSPASNVKPSTPADACSARSRPRTTRARRGCAPRRRGARPRPAAHVPRRARRAAVAEARALVRVRSPTPCAARARASPRSRGCGQVRSRARCRAERGGTRSRRTRSTTCRRSPCASAGSRARRSRARNADLRLIDFHLEAGHVLQTTAHRSTFRRRHRRPRHSQGRAKERCSARTSVARARVRAAASAPARPDRRAAPPAGCAARRRRSLSARSRKSVRLDDERAARRRQPRRLEHERAERLTVARACRPSQALPREPVAVDGPRPRECSGPPYHEPSSANVTGACAASSRRSPAADAHRRRGLRPPARLPPSPRSTVALPRTDARSGRRPRAARTRRRRPRRARCPRCRQTRSSGRGRLIATRATTVSTRYRAPAALAAARVATRAPVGTARGSGLACGSPTRIWQRRATATRGAARSTARTPSTRHALARGPPDGRFEASLRMTRGAAVTLRLDDALVAKSGVRRTARRG